MKKLDWKTITNLKAGPDLDKLVAEFMGVEPETKTVLTNDDGETWKFTLNEWSTLSEQWANDWLGHQKSFGSYTDYSWQHIQWVPFYSTDLLSAMEVAAKLRNDGWLVVMKLMPEGHHFIIPGSRSEYDHPHPDRPIWEGKTVVELTYMKQYTDKNMRMVHNQFSPGDNLMEAICLAALRSVHALQQAGVEIV